MSLPLAAEEGFTGLLGQSGKRENMKMDFSLEGLEDVKSKDLFKVDSEGRCIITDHGHFGESIFCFLIFMHTSDIVLYRWQKLWRALL